jgi:hypothetical protein
MALALGYALFVVHGVRESEKNPLPFARSEGRG